MEFRYGEISKTIIKSFYQVYNRLGYGFLERVYENALKHELDKQGLVVSSQVPVRVIYDGIVVGKYFADLLVDDKIILELKVAETITDAHKAQLINYLKATGKEVGLILNFGPKAQIVRKVN